MYCMSCIELQIMFEYCELFERRELYKKIS